MVVSDYLKCTICDKKYRVRVGVGFDEYQKHYFDCTDCEQPIVFALRAIAPNASIETVENCSRHATPESDQVINFHPNCAFSVNELHHPFAFPSMQYHKMIEPYLRLRPGKFQDIATQFDIPNAPNLWGKLKSILSLEVKANSEKPLKKLIKGYQLQRRKSKPDFDVENSTEMLNDFFDGVFYPRVNDTFFPVKKLIDKLHQESKLNDFYRFYESDLKYENLNRYLSVISDYFKYRDHFGQLSIHARVYDESVDDRIVSSKDFDQIKLYYGQAYEALTSNFTILACINNVDCGRKFDEFQHMNLNKYIKDVEKAKKHKPFENKDEFKLFCEDLDSSLRNGSHHASIWRDGEKIIYRSGGTGAHRDIPYSRYIHMSNKLTISLVALFMVELYIREKYS
ncbi:hypothetical protein BBL81_06325 [Vibrio parahaemolyticus]|uniref:hypothetical protein n=1 Tax=Vibrio parahaemolyticus TaxID=670 RepID=UPI00084B25C2|nr:hypothetical protein [Vibrio parahaemolyticus]EGQ8335524.1 hypothetical protein [Vibrio parahaemolyticus]ODW21921.1 hypothetical protein BBL80_00670 [Vibrio parahaemolyticus]ODW27564.1 hypothetical protein BBL81_06325 [Vibrio parahaemolyticus]